MGEKFKVTEEGIVSVNIVKRMGDMIITNQETIMSKEAFREAFKKYIIDVLWN